MKVFKIAPLAVALASMLTVVPTTQAAESGVPSKGDLGIYTSGNNSDKGPALLFMFDSSRFMAGDLSARDLPGNADSALWKESLAVGNMGYETATDSSGTITYKRRYFQATPLINPNNPKFTTRMTRLKDAVFHLLDTPGLIPEDYKIGAGQYPASLGIANSGPDIDYSENVPTASGQTVLNGAIMVPVKTIGPINSPHRLKIKQYVASLCDMAHDGTNLLQDCGESPMAWSYADAGAYMMGTKTTALVGNGKINTSVLYNQVLRGKDPLLSLSEKTWQYCPPEKRKMVMFALNLYRLTCLNDDWVDLNKGNASSYGIDWNNTLKRPSIVFAGFIIDVTSPTPGWHYYREIGMDSTPRPPSGAEGLGSGIRNSPWDVREDQGYQYKQPTYSECSGVYQKDASGNDTDEVSVSNAIIYFTAGWPYNSNAVTPKWGMDMALSPALPLTSEANPIGGPLNCSSGLPGEYPLASGLPLANFWGCMGGFSKRLNSKNNPTGIPIKTGVVLFTPNNEVGTSYTVKGGKRVLDCDALSVQSQRNACKLGTPGYGYGEGGYVQITRSDSNDDGGKLASVILGMAENTKGTVGMVPTGMPAVPTDDFNANRYLNAGYLPLMSPENGSSNLAHWTGNVRKYMQKDGTYVDQDSKSPFKTTAQAILSATTRDYWTSLSQPYNSAEQLGGAFEKIPLSDPLDTANTRAVYLSEDSAKSLTKLSPDPAAMRGIKVLEKTEDNSKLQRLLLNYMGYGITDTEYAAAASVGDITKTYSSANKTLGGVYHSTPIALTSKLTVKNGEYVPANRYILFGSMDNAVHVVDDKSGKEVMAYFPRQVLKTNGQYKGITSELSAVGAEVAPAFGVDAPWTSYSTYGPESAKKDADLVAKQLYAYGGARLGGKAMYGIDLTDIHKGTFTPKQLFTITPSTPGFSRLGYTWGKPVVTEIRWQGQRKLVVIFTGGYDTYYDKTDDARKADAAGLANYNSAGTYGNAVYVVDAKTGKPLIVASASTTSDATISATNSNMKYSVAGEVKVLDRDADNLTDNIYFADLNGQVFRMDINNAASKPAVTVGTSTTAATNPTARVTRLAALKLNKTDSFGARFYEAPVVTVHEAPNGGRFAVVSVASGDRSNPLWEPASSGSAPNYVYAIYDKDVGRTGLFNTTLITKDVTIDDANLPIIFDRSSATAVSGGTSDYTKLGWRSPLNIFSVYNKTGAKFESTITKAVKALGPMTAVADKLYIPAYNPKDGVTDETGCTAEVKGSSEAMQFCLPYGYCPDGASGADQVQRIKIGKGIQGAAFGGSGDDNHNLALITEHGVTEVKNPSGEGYTNTKDLNSKAPTFRSSFVLKPQLKPMAWYDLQSQRYGTTDDKQ